MNSKAGQLTSPILPEKLKIYAKSTVGSPTFIC